MPTPDLVTLLKELISIPSVNPMGRDVSEPIYFESRLADYLIAWFERAGLECDRFDVAPHRPVVVARYASSPTSPTFLLDAHLDTVPVDGMSIDPFVPKQVDDRIHGRGAADVKGGMAVMLQTLFRMVEDRPANAPNIIMACASDEEANATGVKALANRWSGSDSALIYERPDFAIVAEPTELNVVRSHRGVVRFRLRTRGVACHSSNPAMGRNAIYAMAPIVSALRDYADHLQSSNLDSDKDACGGPALSVGIIQGGSSVNIVPDECVIQIDRRVSPGEVADRVVDDLREFLSAAVDAEFEIDEPWLSQPPLCSDSNGELAIALLESVQRVAPAAEIVSAPYCTHACTIAAAGVPTVVFGPGRIEQAHTHDEFIEIGQLNNAARILYEFLAGGRLSGKLARDQPQ